MNITTFSYLKQLNLNGLNKITPNPRTTVRRSNDSNYLANSNTSGYIFSYDPFITILLGFPENEITYEGVKNHLRETYLILCQIRGWFAGLETDSGLTGYYSGYSFFTSEVNNTNANLTNLINNILNNDLTQPISVNNLIFVLGKLSALAMSQRNTTLLDFTTCHTNCHGNCHSSRNRR